MCTFPIVGWIRQERCPLTAVAARVSGESDILVLQRTTWQDDWPFRVHQPANDCVRRTIQPVTEWGSRNDTIIACHGIRCYCHHDMHPRCRVNTRVQPMNKVVRAHLKCKRSQITVCTVHTRNTLNNTGCWQHFSWPHLNHIAFQHTLGTSCITMCI